MAHLVLGVGTSHGPSIQSAPEKWALLGERDRQDPRMNYQDLDSRPGRSIWRRILTVVEYNTLPPNMQAPVAPQRSEAQARNRCRMAASSGRREEWGKECWQRQVGCFGEIG